MSKLANAEDKYKKLSIANDMTKLERIELKKLLAEAKDKESNEGQGKLLFKVRGNLGSMRIVKLKKIHALTH